MSAGILRACDRLQVVARLLAINHWTRAIESHSLNHPGVLHLCANLDNVNPRKAILTLNKGREVRRLSLLAASPECTHHSTARGGKPCSEQSRATAWHVLQWAEAVQPSCILLENVKEFVNWAPLGQRGKPLKRKKGLLFQTFIQALRVMGYNVEWRIITCSDFGDATIRERLFVLCSRVGPVKWPEPTHAAPDLLQAGQQPWRTAREIVDWDLHGKSIFEREKPLRPNTMSRILSGIRRFGVSQEPFIIQLRGTAASQLERSARTLDQPLPTITAGGFHFGLVKPFLIHTNHQGGDRCYSLDRPTPTITGAHRGELALVEPRCLNFDPDLLDEEADLEPMFEHDRCRIINRQTGATVAELDLLLRMLQPHELAAAMSFPQNYRFSGSKEDACKQIGNAVPVRTAATLAQSLLSSLPIATTQENSVAMAA